MHCRPPLAQVLPNGTVWLTELMAKVAAHAQGPPWQYKASEAQARAAATTHRRSALSFCDAAGGVCGRRGDARHAATCIGRLHPAEL